MTRPRYVRLYEDSEGRFISDQDYSTWTEAELMPAIDIELVKEVVRLVTKEEETEQAEKIKELERSFARQSIEIEQFLGRALGFPWYKDDPKNFPNATESDGVCVGDHTPESLAAQAANALNQLKERINLLQTEISRLKAEKTLCSS